MGSVPMFPRPHTRPEDQGVRERGAWGQSAVSR